MVLGELNGAQDIVHALSEHGVVITKGVGGGFARIADAPRLGERFAVRAEFTLLNVLARRTIYLT